MAVKYRPGVGRHASWLMSVYMSTKSRPTYRPRVSTDALSTHDPISVTSPIVINMPTRELLSGETKSPLV